MPSRAADSCEVAFRVDGCDAVGAGHLTRCRALAAALAERGVRVGFVLGSPSAGRASGLEAEGFAVRVVDAGDLAHLSTADAAATAGTCTSWGATAVVVDHYGARAAFLELLATSGLRVGAIDDLGDRDLTAAVWILNQNLGATPSLYGDDAGRTLLVGSRFALLRPGLAAATAAERTFSPADHRVLVTLGGSAPASLYEAVLAELDASPVQLEVRVLAADAAHAVDHTSSAHRVEVLGRIEEIAGSILWADVAVCAGGSTCWELLALGTPFVPLSLSADQDANVAALAAAGLAEPAGADLGAAVGGLLLDAHRRAQLSRLGRCHVDGHGATRAAASLASVLLEEDARAAA